MYDEPVNLNPIQMTGRYGKEVYLEVDIVVIQTSIIGTIIYKHTEIKIHYIKRKNLTQYVECTTKPQTYRIKYQEDNSL